MKKIILIVGVISLIITSCGNRSGKEVQVTEPESEESVPLTSIQFTNTKHDFGKVKEGEKVVCEFEYQNTGNANLMIYRARASCGCTTPRFDPEPLRPGEKGTIKVSFNTKGYPGRQYKRVKVTSNTDPAETVLAFVCEVEREKTEDSK